MGDYIVRATAADHQIRAFAITSREMVEQARSIHNTSPVATAALGRLLSAGAMMGVMMKGEKDEHNKIAFCDLTCSEEKYVNPNDGKYPLGKRAKASSQMRKSLERLLLDPLMAHYILTFPEKICLFGWRDYDAPDVTPLRGDAARNMLAFMRTPSANSRILAKEISVIGHNFSFVQVKYPSVYKW